MGAVFAGAARAPITAVLILFELTGEYTIILPLMAAIVLGTGISHLVCRDTIYSLKLRRRGVFLDDEGRAGPLDGKRVADAMEPLGPILRADEPLSGAAAALGQAPNGQLPVVDAAGRYGGVITSQDLADALAEPAPDDSVLALATRSEEVRIDDPLGDALAVLDIAGRAVPVLDRDGHNVVGWLSHRGVLAALHAAR
jgi:CIC family chloride channel protein